MNMTKTRYKLFGIYRASLGYIYRAIKKVTRYAAWYHTHTGSLLEGMRLRAFMQTPGNVVDKTDVKNYKKRWRVLSSKIPSVFMHVYPAFSRVKSDLYVPDNLYFTHIEPMLNNVEYSRSFADKNMYSLLFEKDVQPRVLLRKMHGRYIDGQYAVIQYVDKVLSDAATEYEKLVLKHSISSQGGKNISILKSKNGQLMKDGHLISRQWLDKWYGDNFLVQAHVQQHPFYSQFNSSSLNTLRVFTYRSVKDEKVHVLHSLLRVGKEGAAVDNISLGGRACGISPDGRLNGVACDIDGQLFKHVGKVDLNMGVRMFKYDDIMKWAIRVAEQQFYSRVIGFDFCVDDQEQVRLIELNNYDIGVDILQQCNGPLFGEFTEEVISYCEGKRKGFRTIIR